MAGGVTEVCSEAELQAVCGSHKGLTTLLLWAPWHPPSVHLARVFDAIAADQRSVYFTKVNADICPNLADLVGANQVPFVAFLNPKGVKIDALAGADPPKLVEKVKALAGRPLDVEADGQDGPTRARGSGKDLNAELKDLIDSAPVMLFMKGCKSEPHCKFSKQAVAILAKHNVDYSTFDILKDEEVRQGLKDYSNWKTYPQLYISGELMGGVDIMKEMDEDGSLSEAVGTARAPTKPLKDRLKDEIKKAPVTVFMKGTPEEPRCGFSRKLVALLNENSIQFASFDILSDEDVRQGLKEYSNWPTYPQLYNNGKLIGGLDIVKELADEGSL
eukprot:CAMPEP_0197626864 /NCGR_PEP_ID=MMETSP1338-20131121/5646_1 /TAXON_ID=43686 ORGANISM="Pelagodinium beii, Strain RCC1491" /NCGR_SAMPLE_ID=MMETSP1338 /ASSEMBLY_ACC=CAM_ASM_000754 /LENGTH=330 /DNA_ID=CAMNT_0043197445 /DNA_START=42 /DNA_END=1030 /DNA_ORIENTATION=+